MITRKITISGILLIGILQFSCKPKIFTADLDEAVAIAKKSNKKLLFIAAANGCDPCDNLLRKVKDNDTVKRALKDYQIIVYSGDLNNLSLANKIIQNINSPATFVFDEKQSIKNVVFGYRNAKAYIGKINENNIKETEKKAFDKLLKIVSNLRSNRPLNQSELVVLKSFTSSFYSAYLSFKNCVLSKQHGQALEYAADAEVMEDRLISVLYSKELSEMKSFKNNL